MNLDASPHQKRIILALRMKRANRRRHRRVCAERMVVSFGSIVVLVDVAKEDAGGFSLLKAAPEAVSAFHTNHKARLRSPAQVLDKSICGKQSLSETRLRPPAHNRTVHWVHLPQHSRATWKSRNTEVN